MDQQLPNDFNQPSPQNSQGGRPGMGMAIAALILGILAMTIPIPVLDVIMGVVGLALAGIALNKKTGGVAVVGLVLSIIGTLVAISFTISTLSGGSSWWGVF